MKPGKSKKKHAPVGQSMRVFRKQSRADSRKQAEDLRSRVTIKTLQRGGRIVATVDPVTGRVLERERNPRYVPKDKEFSKLLAKKRAEQKKN